MAQRHHIVSDMLWLPPDTEESILGTDLHQQVIRELITSLEWAVRQAGPWAVGGQTRIDGFQRRDGTIIPLFPDVFIYPQPIDPQRKSRSLPVDGPPVLAMEIISESTARNDLDETWGKAYVYAVAGVREYLAFDPTGDSLPARVRAWRQENGVFVPWPAEQTGRWQSREIAASFAVDGLFLRVYTADNVPVLFDMEARQALEDARLRAAALERRSQDDE